MLHRIAAYQERKQTLKRKIKKAMIYPIAVLIIASIVTLILLVKVVPVFSILYQSSNVPLPGFTQSLISMSQLLQTHGWMILSSISLVFTSILYLYRHPKYPRFKHFLQVVILKIPVLNTLINHTLLAGITRTLATTLAAGVTLSESLETIALSTSHIVYHRLLHNLQQALKKGQSLYLAMQAVKHFRPMILQMVKIGETSGSLDRILDKIATHYEEKMENNIDACMTLLEPMIMILLGLLIGGLVIALYLPIFNMGSVF
jgi:type IV pilus assembly protein PilC